LFSFLMELFQPVMHSCSLPCRNTRALTEEYIIPVYLLHVCIILWKCVRECKKLILTLRTGRNEMLYVIMLHLL
jgi:hypothetical protein